MRVSRTGEIRTGADRAIVKFSEPRAACEGFDLEVRDCLSIERNASLGIPHF